MYAKRGHVHVSNLLWHLAILIACSHLVIALRWRCETALYPGPTHFLIACSIRRGRAWEGAVDVSGRQPLTESDTYEQVAHAK